MGERADGRAQADGKRHGSHGSSLLVGAATGTAAPVGEARPGRPPDRPPGGGRGCGGVRDCHPAVPPQPGRTAEATGPWPRRGHAPWPRSGPHAAAAPRRPDWRAPGRWLPRSRPWRDPGPWPIRAVWLLLPLLMGPLVSDLLEGRSRAVGWVASVLIFGGWAVGLVAALVPHPLGLTALRVLAPAALGAIAAMVGR